MSLARRATIEVTWQGKDITRDLAPHLLGLTYADNLTGAADDLSLELEDRDGLWSGDWRPAFGDSVVASLKADPWLTRVTDLRLGRFAHDKITLAGPPRKATLKCVSAPLATGLRRRKRTHSWNKRSLKGMAEDIAARARLTLQWDGAEGAKYPRREQRDKSDLEFLEEGCKEIGRTLKVTEGKIVIFDELALDSSTDHHIGKLDLIGGHVLTWSFDSDDSGRYGSCHITFFDPRTGKTHAGEYTDKGNPDGQTLELRMPLSSVGEAAARAKALLRNANRFATKGRIVVIGDPGLVAGVTFDLTNAFGFDGKFIATKAEHRPVNGYTTTLDVRRCLEGY